MFAGFPCRALLGRAAASTCPGKPSRAPGQTALLARPCAAADPPARRRVAAAAPSGSTQSPRRGARGCPRLGSSWLHPRIYSQGRYSLSLALTPPAPLPPGRPLLATSLPPPHFPSPHGSQLSPLPPRRAPLITSRLIDTLLSPARRLRAPPASRASQLQGSGCSGQLRLCGVI